MVVIGSDHTGIELKKRIINYLYKEHIEYADVTKDSYNPEDDYPDIALSVCSKVLLARNNLGIAICGTGIGISIACNKLRGIRAAVCTDEYMAEYARRDNDANVLCLGARLKIAEDDDKIETIVESFINNFYDGGRHDRRLDKIRNIEEMNREGR
ncbi:MAG: ribose 5-phosphate isomerase B [Clostridia bacterium]|nr:ribose 5-phosphate isomerase B [Clostridia bacterium]